MLEFDFRVRVGNFDLQARGRQTSPQMGLFGPTGCGKTMLLNCLAGLVRPQSGAILLDGQPLFDSATRRHVPPYRPATGYVFQDGRLSGHVTVRANIECGRRRNAQDPDLAELTEALDLGGLLDRPPDTLSGGERHRVVLARALAAATTLLLLDEPLASIDEASRLRILSYLARTYELWQVPFIYVSHSLTEILLLTHTSWQMCRGRIARSLRPQELPVGPPRGVDPILNVIAGTAKHVPAHTGYALVSCGGIGLKAPNDGLRVGDIVTVALPARDLMLSLSSPQGLSARNTLAATVCRLEQDGHVLCAVAEVRGNQLIVELTEDAGCELHLRSGRAVYVVVKSHSITVTRMKEKQQHGE